MRFRYVCVCTGIVMIIAIYWGWCGKMRVERFGNRGGGNVYLFGDSVLNNEKYVSQGESVVDHIRECCGKDVMLKCFAQDGATIMDVYSQLHSWKKGGGAGNVGGSVMIVSVGGNDIMAQFVNARRSHASVSDVLRALFSQYKALVDAMAKDVGGEGEVWVMNVYVPASGVYEQFRPIVEEWNRKVSGMGRPVIDISAALEGDSRMFTHGIEPSEEGGKRIAQMVCTKLKS